MGCSGFDVNGALAVCNFGDSQIGALEVEAPADGAAAVYLTGNTSIGMLTVSLQDGFTADHLVEVGPSATTWAIQNFKLYFKPTPAVISGGNFKTGATYFAGNASGNNHSGEGNYFSGLMTHRDQFGFKLQQVNAFTLRLQNQGGVLEHLIGAVGAPTTPTKVAACVHNASSNPTPTPMGAQDFASGVKVSNLDPSSLILDTGRTGRGNRRFHLHCDDCVQQYREDLHHHRVRRRRGGCRHQPQSLGAQSSRCRHRSAR